MLLKAGRGRYTTVSLLHNGVRKLLSNIPAFLTSRACAVNVDYYRTAFPNCDLTDPEMVQSHFTACVELQMLLARLHIDAQFATRCDQKSLVLLLKNLVLFITTGIVPRHQEFYSMFAVTDPRAAMSLPWWRVNPAHHRHSNDFTNPQGHRINDMLNDDGEYFTIHSSSDTSPDTHDLHDTHLDTTVQPLPANVPIAREDVAHQPNCVAQMSRSLWSRLFRRADSPPVRKLPVVVPVSTKFCFNKSFTTSGDCEDKIDVIEGSSLAEFAEPIVDDPPPVPEPVAAVLAPPEDEVPPVQPSKPILFNLFKQAAPKPDPEVELIADKKAISLEELANQELSDGVVSEQEYVINRSPDGSPRSAEESMVEVDSVPFFPEETPLLSDDEFELAISRGPQVIIKGDAKLGMDWPRQTDERVEHGYYKSGMEFHRSELE